MRLRSGGMDIFYIDESNDKQTYIITAVAVPFLRTTGKVWQIVWPDYLDGAKDWRKRINDTVKIPKSKELHGVKSVFDSASRRAARKSLISHKRIGNLT